MKKLDLTNIEINNILVLQRVENIDNRSAWSCMCLVCDKMFVLKQNILTRKTKQPKSCGCLHLKNGKDSSLFKGYFEINSRILRKIKKGAESRNLEYNITKEYMWDLFLKQNRKCALSGVDLAFAKTNKDYSTASLDRIDNKKGYVENNIQWVHKDVNFMKQDYDENYFIEMCKNITTNQQIEKY